MGGGFGLFGWVFWTSSIRLWGLAWGAKTERCCARALTQLRVEVSCLEVVSAVFRFALGFFERCSREDIQAKVQRRV